MAASNTGSLIRKARKKRGWTQGELAKRLKTGQSLISKYERGEVVPPGDVLIRCMQLLGAGSAVMAPSPDFSEIISAHLEAQTASQLREILKELILRFTH